jgi:hypothetical protein
VSTLLLRTTKGCLHFVTEDPTLVGKLPHPPLGISFVCGDGYRGIAYSDRELCPWILSRDRLSFGKPLEGAWQAAWTNGGLSYFAKDGKNLLRLRISTDGAEISPDYALDFPSTASTVQEVPGRNVLLFEHPRRYTSVVPVQDPQGGLTLHSKAPSWTFNTITGSITNSLVAISEGGYSAWELSPPQRDSVGVRIEVARWTLGELDNLEQSHITVPGSLRYVDAAISPRSDLVAAIGDLSDGLANRYLLHLYSLPSLTLVDSQVFENNISEVAKVEFSTDGEVLLVRSPSRLYSWTVGVGPPHSIKKIGDFPCAALTDGCLAISRQVFLVQEGSHNSSEVVYRWVALSPTAEAKPFSSDDYELITQW